MKLLFTLRTTLKGLSYNGFLKQGRPGQILFRVQRDLPQLVKRTNSRPVP